MKESPQPPGGVLTHMGEEIVHVTEQYELCIWKWEMHTQFCSQIPQVKKPL
jgi:hypothetical protein